MRHILNFDNLEKGLEIVSVPPFDFSRKIFLMLYSINRPNFIFWLSLLLEILVNMCIAIVCFPDFGVINFEINVIPLIKPLLHVTKKSRQKLKFLEKKKHFYDKTWNIFHHFSRAFNCTNLSQTWECYFKKKNASPALQKNTLP